MNSSGGVPTTATSGYCDSCRGLATQAGDIVQRRLPRLANALQDVQQHRFDGVDIEAFVVATRDVFGLIVMLATALATKHMGLETANGLSR